MIRHRAVPVLGVLCAVLVGACSAPTEPGGAAGGEGAMVLADPYEPDSLHPLLGYGAEGASKLFDGLVAHDADR